MKLPNAARAIVDIEKLRDYCLSESHPRGKHKARVFASALNLTQIDAPILQAALLEAVRTIEAEIGKLDEHGQRYMVDFEFEWQGKSALIRSAWIIDTNSEIPRLTTCLIIAGEKPRPAP